MKYLRLNSQQGFTLMEVLVAFMILSIGLIGLAGLQLTGVKNGRDAYYRTQAIILGYDITDRMRANITGVTAGNYNAIGGSATSNCRNTTGCTAAQLAADDVALWRASVSAKLPAGEAIVCRDSSPGDGTSFSSPACDNSGSVYVSKVWWDSDRDPSTDDALLSTVFIP